MNDLKNQLSKEGYIKVNNLIDKKLLTKINTLTASLVNAQSDKEKKEQVSTGSIISVSNY